MKSCHNRAFFTTLVVLVSVPDSWSYVVCRSETQDISMDFIGCSSLTELVASGNEDICSLKSDPMCLEIVQNSITTDRTYACFDICAEGTYSTVQWSYSHAYANACYESCEEDHYYQRCRTSEECQEGFCCSLPSTEIVRAGGCGPPEAWGCEVIADSPGDYILDATAECSSIGFGTCVAANETDIRPGYSCANNPCTEMEAYVFSVCGWNPSTNSFGANIKVCSEACADAVVGLRDCPNVASMVEAYQSFSGCQGCGDFFYRQCASTADCPVGYCCSLPPQGEDNPFEGIFDQNDGCGPPAECTCQEGIVSFPGGGGSAISESCSTECSSSELGTCKEIGTADTRNALYECDCSDPATTGRTFEPTVADSAQPTYSQSPVAPPAPTMSPTLTPMPFFTLPPHLKDEAYDSRTSRLLLSTITTLVTLHLIVLPL